MMMRQIVSTCAFSLRSLYSQTPGSTLLPVVVVPSFCDERIHEIEKTDEQHTMEEEEEEEENETLFYTGRGGGRMKLGQGWMRELLALRMNTDRLVFLESSLAGVRGVGAEFFLDT